MKIKINSIFLILIFTISFNNISAQYEDNKYINSIKAIGYHYSINTKLDTIINKYPDLARKAKMSQIKFNLVYNEPKTKILNKILKRENLDSLSLFKAISDEYKKIYKFINFSRNGAITFLNNFDEKYIKGDENEISDFVSTLLRYKKKYNKHPEKEFLDGFTQTINISDNPKSYGIELLISIPKSWKIKNSKRTHIIFSAFSNNIENSMSLVINTINTNSIKNIFNDKYAMSIFKESGLEGINNFEFLKTKINQYTAMIYSAKGYYVRGYSKDIVNSVFLDILYKGKIIHLSLIQTVGANNLDKDDASKKLILNKTIKKYDKINKLIINSIIINN